MLQRYAPAPRSIPCGKRKLAEFARMAAPVTRDMPAALSTWRAPGRRSSRIMNDGHEKIGLNFHMSSSPPAALACRGDIRCVRRAPARSLFPCFFARLYIGTSANERERDGAHPVRPKSKAPFAPSLSSHSISPSPCSPVRFFTDDAQDGEKTMKRLEENRRFNY